MPSRIPFCCDLCVVFLSLECHAAASANARTASGHNQLSRFGRDGIPSLPTSRDSPPGLSRWDYDCAATNGRPPASARCLSAKHVADQSCPHRDKPGGGLVGNDNDRVPSFKHARILRAITLIGYHVHAYVSPSLRRLSSRRKHIGPCVLHHFSQSDLLQQWLQVPRRIKQPGF